jgi:hypothetical protein
LGEEVQTCNPSYSGGKDWKDHGLRLCKILSQSIKPVSGGMLLSYQLQEEHK